MRRLFSNEHLHTCSAEAAIHLEKAAVATYKFVWRIAGQRFNPFANMDDVAPIALGHSEKYVGIHYSQRIHQLANIRHQLLQILVERIHRRPVKFALEPGREVGGGGVQGCGVNHAVKRTCGTFQIPSLARK